MLRFSATTLFGLAVLVCLSLSPASGNPFRPAKPHAPENRPPSVSGPSFPVFPKLALWQMKINRTVSQKLREQKVEGFGIGIVALMGLAFVYGLIHAAGPGHGKVFAVSVILARRPNIVSAVLFGFGIAVCHGISGMAFVGIMKLMLTGALQSGLARVTALTQLVSYGLLGIMGIVFFMMRLREIRTPEPESKTPEPYGSMGKIALMVGIVPCPAVVMILLFALAQDMFFHGLAVAAALTLGMGVCIASIAALTAIGKQAAAAPFQSHSRIRSGIRHGSGLAGAAFLAVLGGWMSYVQAVTMSAG